MHRIRADVCLPVARTWCVGVCLMGVCLMCHQTHELQGQTLTMPFELVRSISRIVSNGLLIYYTNPQLFLVCHDL